MIGEETFDDRETALFISYGRGILENLSAGISAKYIDQKLYENKAKGVGIDAGLLYKPKPYLSLGLNLQDIGGTTITWDTQSEHKDRIPMNIKADAALHVVYEKQKLFHKATMALDVSKRRERDATIHWGAEIWLWELIAVRGGFGQYNGGDGLKDCWTCGISLLWRVFQLDYAYGTHTLGDTHRFSLAVSF